MTSYFWREHKRTKNY